MLSTIRNYLAHQARKPSGLFGRIMAPLVFTRENSHMENFSLQLMSPDKNDYILEIGFGHGRLISELVPQIEEGKVHGIDISRQMVRVASKRNKKWMEEGTLELKRASIADIPYPDNYFDKVFTCNTIYFWPHPKENLEEVKRVLKPNGQFYCALRDKELMESKGSAVTDNREVFENLYHVEEVIRLFEEADFHQIKHRENTENSETVHVIHGSK